MVKRRIKKARITHISLVPRGANQLPILWKSEGSTVEMHTLVKVGPNFQEEGLLTAVVYAPESEDSQGDVASAQVIKEMAYGFLSEGGNIDIKHDLKSLAKTQIAICETSLIQKGDPRFVDLKDYNGKSVDATDGWAVVLKVLDPELRKLYREGGWQGVSMFGPAEVEVLKQDASRDDISDRIVDALTKRLGGKDSNQMDAKELAEALSKNNEALIAGLAAALKPAAPPVTPVIEKKAEIPFEGDPTDADDIAAHLGKIELAKVDWSDPKAVAAYHAKLVKGEGDSSEVERLKKRLAKLEGKSNQDAAGDDDTGTGQTQLAKNVELGRKMAAHINKQRGFAAVKAE